MNILVTGANGQLGMELRSLTEMEALFYEDYHFIFTSHADLDISSFGDVDEFVKKNNIDVIVNCAAYTNVEKAETEENIADKTNWGGPLTLAEISNKYDIPLIHVSTDYVFNGKNSIPYEPNDKCKPINAYGRSKRLGEEAVILNTNKHIIIRTSWLYSRLSKNNFVYKMAKHFFTKDEPREIKVVMDQVGSPTNASNLAVFIYDIITHEDYLQKYGIYHYCNDGVASWYDLAFEIKTYIDKLPFFYGKYKQVVPCQTKDFPTVAQRPHYSVLSTVETKKTFPYHLFWNWKESLEDCLNEIIPELENEYKTN